jgi:cytochrome c553
MAAEELLQKVLKWIAIAGGALIALVVLAAALLFLLSERPINRVYDISDRAPPIPSDSASLARGEHLVKAVAKCADCHGDDLGGSIFYSSMPFGLFAAPNLTSGRGGVAASYTDLDWVRAIRHAVRRDGRPLPWMPADAYVGLSDADLADVIAYVKSVKPANRSWPASRYGPLARLLLITGKLPLFQAALIDHSRAGRATAAPGVTPEYGRYLAHVGGCASCHGQNLRGGLVVVPGSPPSADLAPVARSGWTEADFFRVFREGKRPDGRVLDPNYMPWKSSGLMTDDELHAIWAYLRTLPATTSPAGQ